MSDNVQAALISGLVALLIWFGSNYANRRAEASKAVLDQRSATVGEKAVDLSVLQASLENLKGRVDDAEERAARASERADAADRARRAAESRAGRGEQRAERAERKATETANRCDKIEQKMELLAPFVDSLQAEIVNLGGHPLATPPELIPPLT